MARLTQRTGERMGSWFGGGGSAMAIHATATIHIIVGKRRRVGPVVGILMTGFTIVRCERMVATE